MDLAPSADHGGILHHWTDQTSRREPRWNNPEAHVYEGASDVTCTVLTRVLTCVLYPTCWVCLFIAMCNDESARLFGPQLLAINGLSKDDPRLTKLIAVSTHCNTVPACFISVVDCHATNTCVVCRPLT